MHSYTYKYMHAYIHTYIHTYIRIYIHAYIHTYIRKYIHTYMHAYIQYNIKCFDLAKSIFVYTIYTNTCKLTTIPKVARRRIFSMSSLKSLSRGGIISTGSGVLVAASEEDGDGLIYLFGNSSHGILGIFYAIRNVF